LLRLVVVLRVLAPEYRTLRRFIRDGSNDGAPIRFAARLTALGPAFVKLGQMLSTRPDLIPPAYIEALSRLQENAPEVPLDSIRAIIESELGKSVETLFATFDAKPVAAASLAQVHRATLPDGAIVAVKVQRPDMERLVCRDLDAMEAGLGWVGRLMPRRLKRTNLRAFFAEFRRYTIQELDFSHEGRIIDRFRANFQGRVDVKFPAVYWSHTSRRVLTMSLVEGVPTVNSIRLALRRESVETLFHGRHAQADLVGSHRVVPIKSFA
jgi:ubiquinone biosynthesis protein